ncbi:MAG TPA: DUF2520 domain-containing protein [Thermoanaerobaculia bacterium]|nr:DUF2520 domain-containing protein [Thermoanaerobaculia bacterium]
MPLPNRPLADLRFTLIGPGRVGESLGHWAIARGARCVAVVGRRRSAGLSEAAARLGAPALPAEDLAGLDATLTLLAVPDAALADVARRLAGRIRGVAIHVSGLHGPSALAPLAATGCRTGALHPLRAFPRVEPDPGAARGIFYAIDGAAEARALARRLAEAFGGVAGVVPEDVRPLYHLAATLAAAGVATAFATACTLADAAGVPEAARRGYAELARGALEAAATTEPPARAITGPVVRGDLETVERHLAALGAARPELRATVVALALATLARIAESGPLGAAQRALAERLGRPDLLDRTRDPVLGSRSPV